MARAEPPRKPSSQMSACARIKCTRGKTNCTRKGTAGGGSRRVFCVNLFLSSTYQTFLNLFCHLPHLVPNTHDDMPATPQSPRHSPALTYACLTRSKAWNSVLTARGHRGAYGRRFMSWGGRRGTDDSRKGRRSRRKSEREETEPAST